MNKTILNFICKNESSVIERMLNSAVAITDAIVALDTGSTDDTISLIKSFGEKNNIPTYVYEEAFTNFADSRNKAREYCNSVLNNILKWNPDTTWSYFFDCDEVLVLNGFKKEQLKDDLYIVETVIADIKYTRNTFTKLSKKFLWTGPIHEYIKAQEDLTGVSLLEGLSVKVNFDGASWSISTHEKYKGHAIILEDYIKDNNNRNPRWIFYTAQSWYEAASSGETRIDEECLRRALTYYKERLTYKSSGNNEELFFSQYMVGKIKKRLNHPWGETLQEFMKAYSMDPLRAEPIDEIVSYYTSMGEWNVAFAYSTMAISIYHAKSPDKVRFLFVNPYLYNWKLVNTHATICYYVGRKDEARRYINIVMDIYKQHNDWFKEEDITKIKHNFKIFNQ